MADILQPNPGPALSATRDGPAATLAAPDATSGAAPAVVETPAGPDAEAPAAPAAEPAAVRPREGLQQRFSELAQQRREAEARVRVLSDRLELAVNTIERLSAPKDPPATPAAPDPRPTREQFSDPDGYDAALTQWASREGARTALAESEAGRLAEETKQRTARENEQANVERARIQTEYDRRVAAAREKYPDYDEATARDDLQISVPMAAVILTHEAGPELAYHLSQHPEEAARIAAFNVPGQTIPQGQPGAGHPMPDASRQLFELGRLAARLERGARPAATRAPPPITPVVGNGAAVAKSPGEMTTEEYAAWAKTRNTNPVAWRRPGARVN